ncbi:MAG TPA: cellulase family glycosylhydrolase, partial [Clostridiales bacterium]|nr:cellulase family glycosylhydrolase [Clostridiales bacterium]
MKKPLRMILCFALAAALALPLSAPPAAAAAKPAGAVGFTADDYLTVNNRELVNRRGEKVKLKGANLGAWLIMEDWLCPYEEVGDNYELLETLIARFGVQKAYELMNTYEDNFITAYDLDQIAAMGFNCVRVPFWYRNFYYDDNGSKILDSNGDWDFSRLDWVVRECSARRIYVILDMHGAPGFQSDAPHSGKADSNGLFAKTPQGERYRELTDELWTAIAARFRGNPAVAMYDLLNEPCCDMPVTELQRRIYNEGIYKR